MHAPNLDHLTDSLPKLSPIFVLKRDIGSQYDANVIDMGASTSKPYLERLMAQIQAAEHAAQLPQALSDWRASLVAKGVPAEVAAALESPGIQILASGFEFVKSYMHIEEIEVIDHEKAVRREAMRARADEFDTSRNCAPPVIA